MGVEITAPIHDRFEEILTDDAMEFLARLHREFEPRRRELLDAMPPFMTGGSMIIRVTLDGADWIWGRAARGSR